MGRPHKSSSFHRGRSGCTVLPVTPQEFGSIAMVSMWTLALKGNAGASGKETNTFNSFLRREWDLKSLLGSHPEQPLHFGKCKAR